MKLKMFPRLSILVLLLALFFSILMAVNFGNTQEFHSFSLDQTLHFQTEEVDLGDYGRAFLMDTAPVNVGVMETASQVRLVSLPLASNFTFSNVTITVYHTLIPVDGYQLQIKAGWLDIQNQSHVSHFDYENLEVGAQVTSHSFAVYCCGIEVSEGERFWLELQTNHSDINIFWGDLTHDSRVSYDGAASFIPEFSSILVLPLLMLLALIAVAQGRRKQAV